MPSLVQTSFPADDVPVAVYTLTLANPPDHRLTAALLADLLQALDAVERDWWERRERWKAAQSKLDKDKRAKGPGSVGGAVIIRGEGEKFFSNGACAPAPGWCPTLVLASAARPSADHLLPVSPLPAGLSYEDSLKDPKFHPCVYRNRWSSRASTSRS